MDSYDHPHPGIRQFYISGTITTILTEHYSTFILDSLVDTVSEAIRCTELIYNGIIEYKRMPLYIFYTEKGQRHFLKLNQRWKDIREILNEYAFTDLAPYEEIEFNKSLVLF